MNSSRRSSGSVRQVEVEVGVADEVAPVRVARELGHQLVPFRAHRRHVEPVHRGEVGGVEARAQHGVALRQLRGLADRPGGSCTAPSAGSRPRRVRQARAVAVSCAARPAERAGAHDGRRRTRCAQRSPKPMRRRRAVHQHCVARADLDALRDCMGVQAFGASARYRRCRGRRRRHHDVPACAVSSRAKTDFVGDAERLHLHPPAGRGIVQRQPPVGPLGQAERDFGVADPAAAAGARGRASWRAGSRWSPVQRCRWARQGRSRRTPRRRHWADP